MDEETFKSLARRSRLLVGEYGAGYLCGLRRHYHGPAFGRLSEHAARLAKTDEYGRGYGDGFRGSDPMARMGRPPIADPGAKSTKRPRSIRLGDEHWAKLQRLGTAWLEVAIDEA